MGSPVSLCDGFDARRLPSSRETTEEDDYALFSDEEEEEWCGENRYCFYFVKQFAYDDPEIKSRIDEADNEIYNCNSERIHIANRLKAIRAERLTVMKDQEVNSLSERLSEIKMEMELLDAQMSCVLDQRDRAFERIKFLRIQRDKGNATFFQSRVVMKKAIELAACGNVRDLEELANSEVDKFMSRWNNDKAFRDDYKKRILPSLEERKLRRHERIRSSNGDETAENKGVELKRFSTEEEEESDDEKFEKEEEETDRETLKEKKREEQLEKARFAMERKRKLHEKAAAKAAIKAKKEAEKKLKELEKRAKKKKKAALESNSYSPSETVTEEGSEPEKTSKEKPVNERSVSWRQQRSFRYRHHKKGNEAVPKAILRRRRAYRLWVWSVSSAALALPLALLILFFYVR